ncbi:hypothetical protein CLHUN_03360 [Ruminiclostridium hungatei]|uniref:Uncharacterized protein n=1 Tax=Ruminiclostridium hungatei TaxID=48256 RepID=A0A1V4SQ08_RUMHU|nr:hypothetical protein [Ruminiclostridium hungatei]OPX45863.1 hypothetical protein CLHUN_03360 [Ruminiclostridium hungatei]
MLSNSNKTQFALIRLIIFEAEQATIIVIDLAVVNKHAGYSLV